MLIYSLLVLYLCFNKQIVTGQIEKIGLGSHYSKYLHTALPQTGQKNHLPFWFDDLGGGTAANETSLLLIRPEQVTTEQRKKDLPDGD